MMPLAPVVLHRIVIGPKTAASHLHRYWRGSREVPEHMVAIPRVPRDASATAMAKGGSMRDGKWGAIEELGA